MKVFKALTIAGSDSGGGAGIQADVKTFQELGVYGMTAITAITAQNTTGVQGVYPVSVEGIAKQIDSIGTDLTPDAVKTGMLFNSEIIKVVAKKITQYQWSNLVIDPVMIAKGGSPLLQAEAIEALKDYLLPIATVITPNIPEAEVISGIKITNLSERKEAAKLIYNLGAKNVMIKGGHEETDQMIDLLYDGNRFFQFESKRIATKNTHGTGCTFSAAITAELAKGKNIVDSISVAKHFIQAAIEDDLRIGTGHGPTNHWAYNKRGALCK
ncbi:bifunctional hydroxymethylpyrimidine kinase/phosphomethylpyrimidine kinase [Schinkia azotoformans]|uniref:bifunctional hydroxymethylpyrimidine kinase/phosphomethylpyrimidine kinase n=1 Tax=Schinkia azotoformans TaxID=1454 RepID=UPI002DB72B3F|nr:bifunctional hydroxymethylpyrimidine kinase/phosphomethylpyrimidine kinase [Schinkia azotoformans]MEC1718279.1 bifunctional hydroxymethylpyrimidine kinase/phosphomethylpyrimidine kinase [Schinkia azotoformans]MEC1743729.1 bifunctional hydroxymethylpyrimidine kinase/phosphomethylpyrimidine kinase [Schinkia azotoformans]MEC1747848.1 bifunctional hydroxymethylpyrimidine kinase/phosphomethylpyrimidine kinase [Schinkia azotoformans]MEC1760597.1 bifunctional hydroxymethylpyrimidine kinase/phosphom